jgi:hypothetical protein
MRPAAGRQVGEDDPKVRLESLELVADLRATFCTSAVVALSSMSGCVKNCGA